LGKKRREDRKRKILGGGEGGGARRGVAGEGRKPENNPRRKRGKPEGKRL